MIRRVVPFAVAAAIVLALLPGRVSAAISRTHAISPPCLVGA